MFLHTLPSTQLYLTFSSFIDFGKVRKTSYIKDNKRGAIVGQYERMLKNSNKQLYISNYRNNQ